MENDATSDVAKDCVLIFYSETKEENIDSRIKNLTNANLNNTANSLSVLSVLLFPEPEEKRLFRRE